MKEWLTDNSNSGNTLTFSMENYLKADININGQFNLIHESMKVAIVAEKLLTQFFFKSLPPSYPHKINKESILLF